MNALLEFSQIRKHYGPVTALAGIDLEIDPGEVLALLGPNGAGKSTLLGCLLGLTLPASGRVLFRGRPISDCDRQKVGYLAERIAVYLNRSVWENGSFFARLKNQSAAELQHQLQRVGLFEMRDRLARQLSKGMLQRLGLAIALCGAPELIVLDEPFNGLDPALLEELQEILKNERARGATLLVATHTISAIEPLATHAAILLNGQLAAHERLDCLREEWNESALEQVYHAVACQRRKIVPMEAVL